MTFVLPDFSKFFWTENMPCKTKPRSCDINLGYWRRGTPRAAQPVVMMRGLIIRGEEETGTAGNEKVMRACNAIVCDYPVDEHKVKDRRCACDCSAFVS